MQQLLNKINKSKYSSKASEQLFGICRFPTSIIILTRVRNFLGIGSGFSLMNACTTEDLDRCKDACSLLPEQIL